MLSDIDLLEYGSDGQSDFRFQHNGQNYVAPSPLKMGFQEVLFWLREQKMPNSPDGMPLWKLQALFARWSAFYDLPDFGQAQRLAYLVDHYRSEIVYDLSVYTRYTLGDLWRGRRWRTLLDILDHLPQHSWFAAVVATDDEHAKQMAAAMIARKEGSSGDHPAGPSQTTWTPEVAMMANLLDATRVLTHTLVAVNTGKAGKPPEPTPRPISALDRAMKAAEHERRRAKHEALADRILARRKKPKS